MNNDKSRADCIPNFSVCFVRIHFVVQSMYIWTKLFTYGVGSQRPPVYAQLRNWARNSCAGQIGKGGTAEDIEISDGDHWWLSWPSTYCRTLIFLMVYSVSMVKKLCQDGPRSMQDYALCIADFISLWALWLHSTIVVYTYMMNCFHYAITFVYYINQ